MKTNELKSIVNSLKETAGKNDKLEILKKLHENNSDFFKFTYQCYNNLIQFNIKKINVTTPITENDEVGEEFFDLLNKLSKRIVTGNAATDEVTNYLKQYDVETQKILIDLIKKNMKLGVSESSINKILGKKHEFSIPNFKVQLANTLKLDKRKKYNNDFLVSAKMDGIRAIAINENSTLNLFKRSGKPVDQMEKIINELNILNKEYYKKYEVEIGYIDGELFTEDIHFNEIISAVSKTKNTTTNSTDLIYFNIFATDIKDYTQEITDEMLERFDEYKIIIAEHKLTSLKFVDYELITLPKNEEEFKSYIIDLNAKYVEAGYEGIMLRDVNKPYEWKRSDALLKFKHFFENDFEVVGVEEGDGDFKGKLGALVCSGKVDGKEINFKVGSGFKEAERELIWNNQQGIIGKTIEVKYQEISNDVNGTFSLRFPVFLKIKNDR